MTRTYLKPVVRLCGREQPVLKAQVHPFSDPFQSILMGKEKGSLTCFESRLGKT